MDSVRHGPPTNLYQRGFNNDRAVKRFTHLCKYFLPIKYTGLHLPRACLCLKPFGGTRKVGDTRSVVQNKSSGFSSGFEPPSPAIGTSVKRTT